MYNVQNFMKDYICVPTTKTKNENILRSDEKSLYLGSSYYRGKRGLNRRNKFSKNRRVLDLFY